MRDLRWTIRMAAGAVAAAALLTGVTSARAQSPSRPGAALVMELSGGQIAGVEAFRELPAGTTLTVPAGTKLVFQHYGSCRRYTLTGGVVTIRTEGVDFSGGARPTETRSACPKKLALKEDGASAATVMRSAVRPRLAVSTRPEFVIVGAKADDYVALRVRRGLDVVLERPFAGRRDVRWPSDAPALVADATYELELLPARADAKPLVIGFRTLDAAAADDAITLVSVE